MPSRFVAIATLVACLAGSPWATAGQKSPYWPGLDRLEQDTQRLDVSSGEIFRRAHELAGIEPSRAGGQGGQLIFPDTQKRLSRSPVDILLRRIGLPTSQGFVEASLKAQPAPQAAAIVIESGSFSLEEVRQVLQTKGFDDDLEKGPEGYVAHRPIFIWSGGALKIGPGERLAVDGSQGAFVVNTGVLEIDGAHLGATGATNSGFRPFLLTTFGGATLVSRSEITGLGFPGFLEGSGVAFTHQQFSSSVTSSILKDNIFKDGAGVALAGVTGLDIVGNRFVDGPQTAVLVKAARDVRIADNIVSQRSGAHAIKVTDGSSHLDISHNIIIGSPGNGIFVDGGSTTVRISDNLVGRSRLTGISVDGAACVAIERNVVLANLSRGIAIRSVLNGNVEKNDLLGNASAGLAISGQFEHSSIRVSHNNFVNNRFGLSGSTVGEVSLLANDFSRQLPRVADGDFATNLGGLLEFAASDQPGEFKIKATVPTAPDDFSQFSAVDFSACVAKKGT